MANIVEEICGNARESMALGMTALAAMLTSVTPAAAEPLSPLAVGLLGSPAQSAPTAEKYATPNNDVRFVLDRSNGAPLLRFDGSEEVLALRATPGARGDEILKTDTGHVLLRVTSLGGVIVYPDAKSAGAPASPVGPAKPLSAPVAPAGGLAAKLSAISAATSKKLGRPILFVAQSVPGAISGVAAEAAQLAADALVREQGAGVARVVILPGAAPATMRQGDTLRVVVAAPLGYAGRPSTAALTAAAR